MSPAYFLGANSCVGFASAFDSFTRESGITTLNVIKGGPGCGKSSFMKTIATAMADMGLEVEYFRCSGDPDSLDGILIPALSAAYLDGTPPHVLEPYCVGVTGNYVNLGAFYDMAGLASRSHEALALTRQYKQAYVEAYRYLAAYGCAMEDVGTELRTGDALLRGTERMRSLTRKTLRRGGKSKPEVKTRWLEAFTCDGDIFLANTVLAVCPRTFILDNEYGLAPECLEACAAEAMSLGHDIIRCPDAVFPKRLSAVLVPGAGCGFVAMSKSRAPLLRGMPHVRLDSLAIRDDGLKKRYRQARSLGAELLDRARSSLVQAKTLHDELEVLCNPHVDFGGVYALAETHISALKSFDKRQASV